MSDLLFTKGYRSVYRSPIIETDDEIGELINEPVILIESNIGSASLYAKILCRHGICFINVSALTADK